MLCHLSVLLLPSFVHYCLLSIIAIQYSVNKGFYYMFYSDNTILCNLYIMCWTTGTVLSERFMNCM